MSAHTEPTSNPWDQFPVNSEAWLDVLLRHKCRVPTLREHQLKHGMDLIRGHELLLVIATGLGKTLLLHAPLIAAQARRERGIAFLIVPTKVLAEQQAQVATKNGLRALAINEDSVREAVFHKRNLFAEFAGGNGISLGVMSAQMLRGARIDKLLRSSEFKSNVRWMLIDEMHLVDEESGTYRVPYKAIATMRSRLKSDCIWAGVTGTATPARVLAIAAALGFQEGHYINARYTVDRPNVKYIPRFFQHPSSGHQFFDLSFVIPFGMRSSQEIQRTLIFAKTIQVGYRIMQFLDTLISPDMPTRLSIVKLYNSLMPLNYRREFLRDIEDGSVVRVGVVTDTCTYGTDIPPLGRVILAHVGQMNDSPEVDKQQFGRPGRDGQQALAIAYAPQWVREVPAEEITTKQARDDLKRREQLPAVTRGFYNPTADRCPRWHDLNYNGEDFVLRANCCVVHDPEPEQSRDLAIVAQWIKHFQVMETKTKQRAIRSNGTYRALDVQMKESLTNMLLQWRSRRYLTIRGKSTGGISSLLLPQHLLQRVVERAHACSTVDRFWGVMHDWEYLEQFGEDLFNLLTQVMPEFTRILNDRKQESSEEPDFRPDSEDRTDTSGPMEIDVPTAVLDVPPPLRIVLRPKQNLLPSSLPRIIIKPIPKRHLSPSSPRASRKHPRVNKENL